MRGVIRDNLIDVRDDGSFHLNMDYFDYCTGLTMTNARFDALFGGPPRKPEQLLTQKDMDLAASVQSVCEDVCWRSRAASRRRLRRNGSAWPAASRSIASRTEDAARRDVFKEIWIQPAAGDAGGALGAALGAYHMMLGKPRTVRRGDCDEGRLSRAALSSSPTSSGA